MPCKCVEPISVRTLLSLHINMYLSFLFKRSKILHFSWGRYAIGAGLSSSPPDFNGKENSAFSATTLLSIDSSVAFSSH